ncbi:kinase-like protein [Lojkania enalia]|uniref:Kinase-like protein n=1 Tax=Lojkania enalia TaxID=147567 RepID=A0A9P4N3G0_9PLEO|nr:kinase-like protein [Didymosphaeria enalia]
MVLNIMFDRSTIDERSSPFYNERTAPSTLQDHELHSSLPCPTENPTSVTETDGVFRRRGQISGFPKLEDFEIDEDDMVGGLLGPLDPLDRNGNEALSPSYNIPSHAFYFDGNNFRGWDVGNGSLASYHTAYSSFASYVTAPRSFPIRTEEMTSGEDPEYSTKSTGFKAPGIKPEHVFTILGQSASALVESVLCRRIQLARKRIKCNRKLTREEAVSEVEHLRKLEHSHIVRLVGTYTLRKDLSILLYPAADCNLEDFMDEASEGFGTIYFKEGFIHHELNLKLRSLTHFFGCLSNAVNFMHQRNIKHMDIKPNNVLVRKIDTSSKGLNEHYKIYVADFGIARAYQTAAASETDSPTSYTRTYAAPEVVLQERRGFKADIFSLGCVFVEMLATVWSSKMNRRFELQEIRCNEEGDMSYHANISTVTSWVHGVFKQGENPPLQYYDWAKLVELITRMIHGLPYQRPTALELVAHLRFYQCSECYKGPEPFEAA